MLDLLTNSLLDPLRVGLIVALFITTLRTRHDTGFALPLALGLLFVAVIIPVTKGITPILPAIALGLMANLILIGIVLAVWKLVTRQNR
jgi:hypothetical protein